MSERRPAANAATAPPRVGMLATVRNRRGIVSVVEPFGGSESLLHLVTIEYADPGGAPEERLVWEREPFAKLLEPKALPDVDRTGPMLPEEFDALVRATRWTAIQPFVDPDGAEGVLTRLPVSAPFHGAIQVEDYQLVPLLKALRMPRISLLVADDVGLGKTIEAGLILSELIIRRRVRRVLVLCPASLRTQWRQELLDKFALPFAEVDRAATHALRKQLGLDANPWRVNARVITSYDYFKQADVLEEFLSAFRADGAAGLPWDLLIVDEAHNLAPAPMGDESDLSRMLGRIAPLFEHRLFLTATPHNGHTRSFSGLLERLDPVRFSRTDALSPAEQARVEDVLVRRLKREINERTSPKRFTDREAKAIDVTFSLEERRLAEAFQELRQRIRSLIASSRRAEQLSGTFAIEILGKRLLSGPVPFADSWYRALDGLADERGADVSEVRAAEGQAREETGNDLENESRVAHAVRTVGAWLRPFAPSLQAEIETVSRALEALDLRLPLAPAATRPLHDARFAALVELIESRLRNGKHFAADERLVVFTEYKTTLDSLAARLRERFPAPGAISLLFGGMDADEREDVKAAFNDPAGPVRILLATDAASEGLNLQETARYLLHFDVPWNPARLEQRNGRLDRHGQARDVTVFHFTSRDDADLAFLAHVVKKVDTIREDLGSMGDVFDAALRARFLEGANADAVRNELDLGIVAAGGRASFRRDSRFRSVTDTGAEEMTSLDALKKELDLDPETLKKTLDVALGIGVGRPRLEPDERGRLRLKPPIPKAWEGLVDDTLRRRTAKGGKGALPALVFDPDLFIEMKGGRPVFRPQRDATLLHLGHPLFQRVFATFARARFPNAELGFLASRWTVRRAPLPEPADALLLLTVEELAVNELRETFHHWVRTLAFPVRGKALAAPLAHRPAALWSETTTDVPSSDDMKIARDCFADVEDAVRDVLKGRSRDLTDELRAELALRFEDERKKEDERFRSRQGELSTLIERQSLGQIGKEIQKLRDESHQGVLFDPLMEEISRSVQAKEDELRRRHVHYGELREQLTKDRDRVLKHILPRRYAMRGDALVFPVAVEIRLPEHPRG